VSRELGGRPVRVVALAGVEDPLVLALDLGDAPALERDRAVALAVFPGRANQAQQPFRLRGGVEPEVEGGVGGAGRARISTLVRPHVVREVLPGRGCVRGGEPAGSASNCERLEDEPDLVRVAQVVERQLADAGAAVRHVYGQTQALETPDRLPDRRDAHAEPLGELLEPEGCARGQLAREDRVLELGESGLRHGRIPPALERRPRVQCHAPIVSPF